MVILKNPFYFLLEANKKDSNNSICYRSPIQSLGSYDCEKPKLFVRYQLTNLTTKWGSNSSIYIQDNSNYIIVWDSENNQVLYSFPAEKCIENKDDCEDWNNPQEIIYVATVNLISYAKKY